MSTPSNPAKLSFLIYHEWRIFFEELTPEEQGRLFMAMLDYSEFGALPEFSGVLRMAFRIIRQAMDRNEAKWQQTCASRAQAGRKSAAARAAKKFAAEVSCKNDSQENEDTTPQPAALFSSVQQSPTNPTEPVNEPEYENEHENEYEYDDGHEHEKEYANEPENKFKATVKSTAKGGGVGPNQFRRDFAPRKEKTECSPQKRKTRMHPCEIGKAMV